MAKSRLNRWSNSLCVFVKRSSSSLSCSSSSYFLFQFSSYLFCVLIAEDCKIHDSFRVRTPVFFTRYIHSHTHTFTCEYVSCILSFNMSVGVFFFNSCSFLLSFFTILWAFPEPSWYFHVLYRWLLYCFHHSLQWWDYSLCCNKRKIKTGTFSHAVMHCEWDEKAAHQINMRERIQCHPNVLKFVQVNWARCFYIDIYIYILSIRSLQNTHTYASTHTHKYTRANRFHK